MTVMTPERWQKMKGVLYEALELPLEQRAEFLDRACSGEDSFRREVDSLLSSNDLAPSTLFHSSEPRVPLSSGTKLGHYEVQSLLGAGGMGEVYRGHDARLGRDVAIKVLPPVFSNDQERLRRFELEARAAAALNHPNIVAIHDVGTTNDGIPYVVSELLDGETLRQCLTRGPLPVRKTVDLALQMASGLAAAHEKGIVHRDLKPENLFLTKDGHLKILDFGLAKLVRSPSSPEARTLTEGTSAGAVMGTLGYMPPEQVRGLAVDQRSDIFAAGAIVYEMLSGKRAFCGETRADTIEAILSRDPPALSETNPSVPPSFERIVRRCLEKDANERFHSIRDVAFALAAISEDPVTQGKASSIPANVFRWKLALLAGVLLLVASLLWMWNPGDIRHGFRSASTGQIQSLAVLPLENISGNPEQEYFADGMTDELITSLAGLNEVRVISRTSVMPFKATRKSCQKSLPH
jgi:serine/threonine protein kinase